MAEPEGNDTEITLGIGKLLVLFFGLVILCGISLGVGYSLGRNSARQTAAAAISTAPATPRRLPASPEPRNSLNPERRIAPPATTVRRSQPLHLTQLI